MKSLKLKWVVAGSIAGVAACVGALYRSVKSRIERKIEATEQEAALQTFEGEGGLVLN